MAGLSIFPGAAQVAAEVTGQDADERAVQVPPRPLLIAAAISIVRTTKSLKIAARTTG